MWTDNEIIEDHLGLKARTRIVMNNIHNRCVLPMTIGIFGDADRGKHLTFNPIDQHSNVNFAMLDIES